MRVPGAAPPQAPATAAASVEAEEDAVEEDPYGPVDEDPYGMDGDDDAEEEPVAAAPAATAAAGAPAEETLVELPTGPPRDPKAVPVNVKGSDEVWREDAPEDHDAWRRVRLDERRGACTARYRTDDGKTIYFQTTVAAFKGNSDEAMRIGRLMYLKYCQGWTKEQVFSVSKHGSHIVRHFLFDLPQSAQSGFNRPRHPSICPQSGVNLPRRPSICPQSARSPSICLQSCPTSFDRGRLRT